MFIQGRNQVGDKVIQLTSDEGLFLVTYTAWPTAGTDPGSGDSLSFELVCENDLGNAFPMTPLDGGSGITGVNWGFAGVQGVGYFLVRHKAAGQFQLQATHSGPHSFGEQYAIDICVTSFPTPPGEDPIILSEP